MGKKRSSWRRSLSAAVCLLMVMTAMLLWGRLRLVTGVPRTALAEPEAKQVEAEQAEGDR